MHKRRRRGTVLPPGRSFSFNQTDSVFAIDEQNKMCLKHNNNTETNVTKTFEDYDKNIGRRQRRSSASSMTLPLTQERRRKNSFRIGAYSANRFEIQPQDVESHFTVMLGSPAVGKTGKAKFDSVFRLASSFDIYFYSADLHSG